MLYENEVVPIYNPETGDYGATKELQDAEAKQAIEEGKALEAMQRSDGWGIVESFLKQAVLRYKEALIIEQDLDKIRRLQEAIKSYQNVLTYVDAKIYEGRSFSERASDSEA